MSGQASRMSAPLDAPLSDLWDEKYAATLDAPNLLLYRSNLLGSDLRITNFGGGNTSAKLEGMLRNDARDDQQGLHLARGQ